MPLVVVLHLWRSPFGLFGHQQEVGPIVRALSGLRSAIGRHARCHSEGDIETECGERNGQPRRTNAGLAYYHHRALSGQRFWS